MKKLLLLTFIYSSALFSQTPEFVKIKGGTFTIGDNISDRKNEKPARKISVSEFSMSKTQITVAQYKKYCSERNVEMPMEPAWGWINDHPIVNVKWSDARNYCSWLRTVLNKNVMLPSEAQWEFAARGGENEKQYKHSGGKKMNSLGWYKKNSKGSTHPVKQKQPNTLGLYDMNGNVWEWCMDWYDPNYYSKLSSSKDPENKDVGDKKSKAVRGGGWDSDSETCTVTHRKGYMTRSSFDDRGFRVVILNH